jgi:hypothetical protein
VPTSTAADTPSPQQARADTLAELARFARGADEATLLNFATAVATVAGQKIQRRIGHNGCSTCTCEPTTFVDCQWCGHRVGKVTKRAWDFCSRTCRERHERALAQARRAQEAADRAAYGMPAGTGYAQQKLDPAVWSGAEFAMMSGAPHTGEPSKSVFAWPYPEPDEATMQARRDRDDAVRRARALYGTSGGVGYDPDVPADNARR